MVTFPNAKINIGLDILRKRPDGYHDLQTVMVPVGWTDILEAVEYPEASADILTTTGRPVDCPPEKNLVMKAVKAMREQFSFPTLSVHLHKIIPDGAGLGGGSADAAFTIKMIRDMFLPEVSDRQLAEIASTIGADCPFFIYNRPMLCEATGTVMRPIDIPDLQPLKIAIVKPKASVSTREAYAHVSPRVPAVSLPSKLKDLRIDQWQGEICNDFEQSVFPAYPEIAEVKRKLIEAGAVYASMSGSGSGVFGLFRADKIDRTLPQIFDGCDICVTAMV